MLKMRIATFRRLFKQNPVFFLLLVILGLFPFLDGGTNIVAEVLILILPLPLFLLGLASGEIQFKKLPSWIVFFLLAFLFFVGISVFTSTSQIFSIPAFFQLLAIFLFFNLFLLIIKKENLKQAIWFVFIVSFLLCLLSFHYLLPWAEKPAEMNLVYATYGHSHLADYLLLVIPFVLALFLTAREKKPRFLFGGLLIFYLISLVLTFSRGAFLVLPPVILLLILLLKPQTAAKRLISWLLILIPIGVLLLILIYSLSSFGIEAKLAQPEHWLVKQIVKPEFQAKRLDYWQQALEGFRTRPLFGFGWGTFELIALRFQKVPAGWSSFTHNFYLQTLAEVGIFAFVAFLGFLFLSFRRIWQQVKIDKINPFLLGGFGAILASSLHSLIDYDWHFPAIFLTFLFILASLLISSREPCFWRNRVSPWRRLGGLVILSFLVFIFGWLELAGECFYRKGDYQKVLALSPWPAVRVRKIADKIFEQDFAQGEKIGQRILSLSSQDPSMHYWLADKYYFADKLEKAAPLYQKAIEYNPLGNFSLYRRLGKDALYQFLAQNLEKSKIPKENSALAKELYLIGEGYFKEGRDEETIFWWKKAAEFAPQWSYFHIELASLYLKQGDSEQAEEMLRKCLNLYYPKEHCQEYLDRLGEGEEFESPGFWREKILAIPD